MGGACGWVGREREGRELVGGCLLRLVVFCSGAIFPAAFFVSDYLFSRSLPRDDCQFCIGLLGPYFCVGIDCQMSCVVESWNVYYTLCSLI